jgi:glutaredoxin 3
MSEPQVTLYTANYCGYCRAAKALLERRGIPYREIDLSGDDAGRLDLVRRSGGQRTVPQIWIGERHVGGYTDLDALDRSGELAQLLGRAG